MERSFEAAQLPAALGGAGSSGAAARLPQARGDSDAVHAASTAHDETTCFTNSVTGVRLDPADDAALAVLEVQRRQRSQRPGRDLAPDGPRWARAGQE